MLSCDSKHSSSAAHLFRGEKLSFCEISHRALLPPDCFQQHNSTWQINARCITSISWNNPAMPLCSLVNFGINQLQIQLLTSSPGFHSSLDQPNSHLLVLSLVMALGKHKQILTAFFSTTTALPAGKQATVRLCRLPQTASLFNTSFWQTSLWYKVGQ